MRETLFWNLIDLARTERDAFRRALGELENRELEEFAAEYSARKRDLMTPALLERIEPKTAKRLAEVAERVMALGLDHYEAVFFGEALPAEALGHASTPRLDREASELYRQRTGYWIPRRAPQSDDVELDAPAFWRFIRLAATDRVELRRALEDLRPEDLIALHGLYEALLETLMDSRYDPHLEEPVTRDWESRMDHANWILTLGHEKIEAILSDPALIPARTPNPSSPRLALDDEVQRIFERRYGEEIPMPKLDDETDSR